MVLGLFTFYAMAMLRFGTLVGYWKERSDFQPGCIGRGVVIGNSRVRCVGAKSWKCLGVQVIASERMLVGSIRMLREHAWPRWAFIGS